MDRQTDIHTHYSDATVLPTPLRFRRALEYHYGSTTSLRHQETVCVEVCITLNSPTNACTAIRKRETIMPAIVRE